MPNYTMDRFGNMIAPRYAQKHTVSCIIPIGNMAYFNAVVADIQINPQLLKQNFNRSVTKYEENQIHSDNTDDFIPELYYPD
jgi:hypothetical protein